MRWFRSAQTLLLAAVVLLAACRIEPNPRPEVLNVDSAARVDIRATMEAYQEALLRHDARTIAAFYTADARLQEPGAPDLVGGREIQAALQRFFAAGGVITGLSVESEEIHVDGPVAWETGRYQERSRAPDGSQTEVHGRYVIRWRRGEEARWRIDHFLLNHMPAADVPAQDTAGAGR